MRRVLSIVLVLAGCTPFKTAAPEPDDTDKPRSNDPGGWPEDDPSEDDGVVTLPDGGTVPADAAPGDASTKDAGTIPPPAGKIVSITIGNNVACVVSDDGEMRCWGDYRLAGGGSTSTPKPSRIPIRDSDGGGFLTGVADVAASYRHACARLRSGEFACWGFNNEYQLGDFTRDVNQSPQVTPFARFVRDASAAGPKLIEPPNLTGIGRVSAGTSHSGVVIGGAVLTWGYISGSDNGPLGRGKPSQADAIAPKPVLARGDEPVPGDDRLVGAKSVSLASVHGCAAMQNNTVTCWGDNGSGKLGIGNGVTPSDGRPRLVSVPDSTGLFSVATGPTSSCAVTAMDRVRCWGQNNLGQIGKGTVGSFLTDASVDVQLADGKALADVIDVRVGDSYACALTKASAGGKVYCWGKAQGSTLGDGASDNRGFAAPVASALAPAKVDLTGARLLAVGRSSACVVLGDHDVRCWGTGPIGEAGKASSSSTIPRPVDDL